jgi:hypothetical protein
MAVIDFSEFDPEQVDSGGGPDEGKALVRVIDIDESNDEQIEAQLEVVKHTAPNNVGRTSKVWLKTEGKGAKRTLLFALATGLLTKQDLAVAKAEGTSIDIDYGEAVGKTFFTEFEASEYEGKRRVKVEFQFVNVSDPAAEAYKEALGVSAGKASTKDKSRTAPATVPAGDDDIPF